jgi:DNA helicase HerA-like ATPase
LQQREFVERFNRALFERQIRSTQDQWYFCIYEEAHQYFPQGCLRAKAFQYSVRLLTQGRNFRISMALITQFSSMVDKDAMKFMNQRFFGASNEPNDISYLKGFLNKHAQELKTLDSGEFLYFNKGKISKMAIEPYESEVRKTQIQIPELHSIEPIQPIQSNQSATIALARLGMIALFAVLLLGAIK